MISRARLRVRLAASAVHRLRRGLGGPHRARHHRGGDSARACARTGAHRSPDVSGLPAAASACGAEARRTSPRTSPGRSSRLRARASSSTPTSVAMATRPTRPAWPRPARSCSPPSGGSSSRWWQCSCCWSPGRSTVRSPSRAGWRSSSRPRPPWPATSCCAPIVRPAGWEPDCNGTAQPSPLPVQARADR